jgi:hypothetical protein
MFCAFFRSKFIDPVFATTKNQTFVFNDLKQTFSVFFTKILFINLSEAMEAMAGRSESDVIALAG